MNTTGRKEVIEAVVIAALTATATAFINFGVEELKKHVAKRQAVQKADDPPKEPTVVSE